MDDGATDSALRRPHTTENIRRAEKTLRGLVVELLPDWLNKPGTPPQRRLERRRGEERSNRLASVVSNDLLDYADLNDLVQLIINNADAFSPVFPNSERAAPLFITLRQYRNTISHFRDLTPAERAYVDATCGMIVSIASTYQSRKLDSAAHYANVISVVDDIGITYHGISAPPRTDGTFPYRPGIEVGQTVSLQCEGSDPRGRDLTWRLYLPRSESRLPHAQDCRSMAVGESVELRWIAEEADVSTYNEVLVTLASSGKYKRHHEIYRELPYKADDHRYDDGAKCQISVNPPPD